MDLTREEALKLHRQMWTDMQKELGDCPPLKERMVFKGRWVRKRFPGEIVSSNCFLCEYKYTKDTPDCFYCPINWGRDGEYVRNFCEKIITHGTDWRHSPISEILALPEREDV